MSEKINVLIGANIEGLKAALAESGKSLSDFGELAQQTPRRAKTAIDQLNQSYRDAIRDAKNLALTQGQTSEAFYEAQLKAKNLKSEIEGLNQVVSQTSVGNQDIQATSQKFDMLGHSVTQITRELPAFTNSLSTGFMAVSNNIPMLVDQLHRIKLANAELINQGQPVKSVFSQLAASLFSWNTAISVGVTLLAVYGEKLVNFFTGAKQSKQALDDLKNSQNDLNEKIKMYLMTDMEKEIYKENQAHQEVINGIKARIKQTVILKDEYGRVSDEIRALTFEEVLANEQAKKDLITAEKRYQENLLEIKKSYAKKSKLQYYPEHITPLAPLNPFRKEAARIQAEIGKEARKMQKLTPKFIDFDKTLKGFDYFIWALGIRLDDVEERVGKWSDLMAGLLSNAAVNFGEALVTDDFSDFGKSIIRALGDLAIQIGTAVIALGTAMLLTPAAGTGLAYIAGGAALVTLGSAMKANNVPSPRKSGQNSSGDNNQSQGMSNNNIPSFNPTGMMIQIDGLVRGNNIVVALDNQTRMNRRVR